MILLCSGGTRVFSAGASFDELLNIATQEEAIHFFSGFAHVLNAMRSCSKLIIGKIQGRAVGGGVGLIAGVDYAIATQNADIRLSELAVAIGPFVVGPAVERKIGLSAFTKLTLQPATWHSAKWAYEKGLYHQLCPTIEQLDICIENFITTLCSHSPTALKFIKSSLVSDSHHWQTLLFERAKISASLVLQPDARAILETLKNKK